MLTCNSNGGMDAVAVGIDKRMRILSYLPKEDSECIRAYAEHKVDLLRYRSVHVFHCYLGGKPKTYILVGLDERPTRNSAYEDFLVAKQLMAVAMDEKVNDLGVMVDTLDVLDLHALIDGLMYRNYDFTHYKTVAGASKTVRSINLITSSVNKQDMNRLCYVYSAIYEGMYVARDLVNMPPNELTPRKFAAIVTGMIKGENITVESLNKWAIQKHKMGGIDAVGKGSMNPPQVVCISYHGDPESQDILGIVGKGVTYDSGGLSLKTHKNLEFMKDDMAGAATAVGVIRALMLLKYPVNVIAVMPLVENLPSSMSYHVDDILTMYNGKTVEIKNTDAEGRLVLADALTYAQEKGATKLIDLATLTGACVTALGTVRSGMIGNDQEWMNQFFTVATKAHEKVWQLPADREYEDLLKSDIADMKNVGGPDGGAITAGLFLKKFVADTTPWIHLDIAGTAFCEHADETGYIGATGAGIRAILELLKGETV